MTQAGVASGILNTCRQTGAVLGVSLLGTVVSRDFLHWLPLAFAITAGVQFAGGLAALAGRGKVSAAQAG